jgi:nitroreductase
MTEPWRFLLFTDAGRERLADFCQSLYRRLTPDSEFRQDKFDKLRSNPLKAPLTIAIAMKRQGIEKVPEIEEVEAVACAVHNMHLTASAVGLAAFWSTPSLVYTDEMRQWLGLSDPRDKCLGLFYLGWPASENWPEGKRSDLSEKVVHVMN